MFPKTYLRAFTLCWRGYATSSTPSASTAPPMLLKIRKDMKAAMQSKDSNRLNVLRALLTQTINASKTSTPISTDLQMLALLRKFANASRMASAEFKTAGRQDLVEKEESQLKVMEEYAGCVETVGEEEITEVVKRVVNKMEDEGTKLQMGEVLKRVFSADGLKGKPVERGEVVGIVRLVLQRSDTDP